MVIVGELINTSRSKVKTAVDEKDAAFIKQLAENQVTAGANYVDVNCGTSLSNEVKIMEWLVETVQNVVNEPLCIDTPNPKAMEAGLRLCKKGQPMVNSISAEKERLEAILPLVLKYKCKVIALCMDDSGMPETAEDRYPIVDKLVKVLKDNGVPLGDVYIDPLVKPLSVGDMAAQDVLATVKYIRGKYPEVHTICGMSNVSYGLPQRKVLNQAFLVQLMTAGMNGFILDPTDKRMMGLFYASQALLGQDKFCSTYLKAYRKDLLLA